MLLAHLSMLQQVFVCRTGRPLPDPIRIQTSMVRTNGIFHCPSSTGTRADTPAAAVTLLCYTGVLHQCCTRVCVVTLVLGHYMFIMSTHEEEICWHLFPHLSLLLRCDWPVALAWCSVAQPSHPISHPDCLFSCCQLGKSAKRTNVFTFQSSKTCLFLLLAKVLALSMWWWCWKHQLFQH